jgi:hypothetical protein
MGMKMTMAGTRERRSIGMMNPADTATALDPEIEDIDGVHEAQIQGPGGRGRGRGTEKGGTKPAIERVAADEVRRGMAAGGARSTTTAGRNTEVGEAPAACLHGRGLGVVARTKMATAPTAAVLSNAQVRCLRRATPLP